jgi:hypothetical protein
LAQEDVSAVLRALNSSSIGFLLCQPSNIFDHDYHRAGVKFSACRDGGVVKSAVVWRTSSGRDKYVVWAVLSSGESGLVVLLILCVWLQYNISPFGTYDPKQRFGWLFSHIFLAYQNSVPNSGRMANCMAASAAAALIYGIQQINEIEIQQNNGIRSAWRTPTPIVSGTLSDWKVGIETQ